MKELQRQVSKRTFHSDGDTWLIQNQKDKVTRRSRKYCFKRQMGRVTKILKNHIFFFFFFFFNSSVLQPPGVRAGRLQQRGLSGFWKWKWKPTLCDPVDYGPLQARILEWVAISFSRGSAQPRDRTRVSRIADRCFTIWTTREAPKQSP